MPRSVYHRDSGAFEIFATDDEIRMENLRRENEQLKQMLNQTNFMLSRIESSMSQQGMNLNDNAVDLEKLSVPELTELAQKLGVNPGHDKDATINNIVINATPYQIWKAYDNS